MKLRLMFSAKHVFGKENTFSKQWCVCVCVSCSVVSLIWKGKLHTCNHDLSLSHTILHIHFNFIVMLLCSPGSFAHTCTNTFLKEDQDHLKRVLKGVHSEIMLPFFHRFRYRFWRTLHSCLCEKDFTSFANKCCTPSQNGMYKMMPLAQGLMWLYARKSIVVEKLSRQRPQPVRS